MPPKRLAILGVGLLGGSIGLAARSAIKSCTIVGYGHRQSTLDTALETGVIDEAFSDPAAAVKGADLVILCTPVGLFGDLLAHIGPALAAGAIVTDVGSTKRSVVELAHERLPASVRFVGSHPIAGSEKRGVEYAKADLFRHALCLTTPTHTTDPAALGSVEAFWRLLGMRVERLSPEDHDRLLADVSHLPHALAAALVSMQTDDALALCGKGFLDTTRIAGGDGGLWRDILLDNRDNVRAGLLRLQSQLDAFSRLLDGADPEALRSWLDAAAARREAVLMKKLRDVNPD